VKRELQNLGVQNVQSFNGYVEYLGDVHTLIQSNLWLRTADRVLVKIGEFPAETFDELFEGTKALPWGDWIPVDGAFPVEGRSVKSTLSSVPACQRIVKKAIVESIRSYYGTEELTETGAFFPIEVSLQKDTALLTIDTSGVGLHKRGYRIESAQAPIKETLAAALVLLSRWLPHRPFADPLCGSGTIAIEAALIGKNMAPGANRTFACEAWPQLHQSIWADERRAADAAQRQVPGLDLRASDVDETLVAMAARHAQQAGVADVIRFTTADIRTFRPNVKFGTVVTNPPYGERLGDVREVESLYKSMGRLAKNIDTWSWFVITSHPQFERLFGKPADKNRKLYNGRIETHFYQYLGPLPPRPRANEK